MNIGLEERAVYVLALSFGNLVFGQRVIDVGADNLEDTRFLVAI